MGISVWKSHRHLPFAKSLEQTEVDSVAEAPQGGWALLQQQVAQCTACELHQSRTNTVFGVGNRQADWMIIGEAPSADEEAQGEPFVGRAGLLLNQMLFAIGISRDAVFIANILKCRPPNNRDPKIDSVTRCENFLVQQIHTIKPKVILAVGRIAAQNLLKSKEPIGRLRGQVYQYGEFSTPLVVTYHPAYLLRAPREKSKVWADLVLARRIIVA